MSLLLIPVHLIIEAHEEAARVSDHEPMDEKARNTLAAALTTCSMIGSLLVRVAKRWGGRPSVN